ncbi:MAG: hypothetical protein ACOYNL_02055 [Rickettsiales bacterium]
MSDNDTPSNIAYANFTRDPVAKPHQLLPRARVVTMHDKRFYAASKSELTPERREAISEKLAHARWMRDEAGSVTHWSCRWRVPPGLDFLLLRGDVTEVLRTKKIQANETSFTLSVKPPYLTLRLTNRAYEQLYATAERRMPCEPIPASSPTLCLPAPEPFTARIVRGISFNDTASIDQAITTILLDLKSVRLNGADFTFIVHKNQRGLLLSQSQVLPSLRRIFSELRLPNASSPLLEMTVMPSSEHNRARGEIAEIKLPQRNIRAFHELKEQLQQHEQRLAIIAHETPAR